MADNQYSAAGFKVQAETVFPDQTNQDISAADIRQMFRDTGESCVFLTSENVFTQDNVWSSPFRVAVFGNTAVPAYDNTNEVKPMLDIYGTDQIMIRFQNTDNLDADTKAWIIGQQDDGDFVLGRLQDNAGTDVFNTVIEIDENQDTDIRGNLTIEATIFDAHTFVSGGSYSTLNTATLPFVAARALLARGETGSGYTAIGLGDDGQNGTNDHITFYTGGAQRAEIGTGLVVGTPTGGDKGAGTINATAVYDDNVLLTCYVMDQVIDGTIDLEKWDLKSPTGTHEFARKFSDRVGTEYDPLNIDSYTRHWKEKRHLTSLPNEEKFSLSGMSTGEWIQRLIETVEIQAVHISLLNDRLKTVEAG